MIQRLANSGGTGDTYIFGPYFIPQTTFADLDPFTAWPPDTAETLQQMRSIQKYLLLDQA